MFAELLQKPNQKYFIEAIDTYFALSLEQKKKQTDSQSLFQFDQNDLIEGSNEQLNVKFCENLLEDDCSFSTEVASSDGAESVGDKDKEKYKQMAISDLIVYTEDSIRKFKEDHVLNLQYQLEMYKKMALMYFNNSLNKAYSSPLIRSQIQINEESCHNKYSIKESLLIYSENNTAESVQSELMFNN